MCTWYVWGCKLCTQLIYSLPLVNTLKIENRCYVRVRDKLVSMTHMPLLRTTAPLFWTNRMGGYKLFRLVDPILKSVLSPPPLSIALTFIYLSFIRTPSIWVKVDFVRKYWTMDTVINFVHGHGLLKYPDRKLPFIDEILLGPIFHFLITF